MNINLGISEEMLARNLQSLKNFNFSFRNPVFWLLILMICLILLKFWQGKKALSFSLITASILLLTTQIESLLQSNITPVTGDMGPFVIRLLAMFLILVVFFYYSLIRE